MEGSGRQRSEDVVEKLEHKITRLILLDKGNTFYIVGERYQPQTPIETGSGAEIETTTPCQL